MPTESVGHYEWKAGVPGGKVWIPPSNPQTTGDTSPFGQQQERRRQQQELEISKRHSEIVITPPGQGVSAGSVGYTEAELAAWEKNPQSSVRFPTISALEIQRQQKAQKLVDLSKNQRAVITRVQPQSYPPVNKGTAQVPFRMATDTRSSIKPGLGGTVISRESELKGSTPVKYASENFQTKNYPEMPYGEGTPTQKQLVALEESRKPAESPEIIKEIRKPLEFLEPNIYEDTTSQAIKGFSYGVITAPLAIIDFPTDIANVLRDPGGVYDAAARQPVITISTAAGGAVATGGLGKLASSLTRSLRLPAFKEVPSEEITLRPGVIKSTGKAVFIQEIKGEKIITKGDFNVIYDYKVDEIPTRSYVAAKTTSTSLMTKGGLKTETAVVGLVKDKIPDSSKMFTERFSTITKNINEITDISKTEGIKTVKTGQTSLKGLGITELKEGKITPFKLVINDKSEFRSGALIKKLPASEGTKSFTFSEKGELLKAEGSFPTEVNVAYSQIDVGLGPQRNILNVLKERELLRLEKGGKIKTYVDTTGRHVEIQPKGVEKFKIDTGIADFTPSAKPGGVLGSSAGKPLQITKLDATLATKEARTAAGSSLANIKTKIETEMVIKKLRKVSTKESPKSDFSIQAASAGSISDIDYAVEELQYSGNPLSASAMSSGEQSKLKSIAITPEISKIKPTAIGMAEVSMQVPILKTGTATTNILKELQGQDQKPATITITRMRQDTASPTQQRQITSEIVAPITLKKERTTERNPSRIREKDISFFGFKTPQPSSELKAPRMKPVRLFDVSIKRRGKLRLISSRPLPKGMALRLGAERVMKTPAASFKLTPKGSGFAIDKPFRMTKMFRPGKKDRGLFVEKSRYRINTPGEIRGITRLGIESKKRKGKKRGFGSLFRMPRILG